MRVSLVEVGLQKTQALFIGKIGVYRHKANRESGPSDGTQSSLMKQEGNGLGLVWLVIYMEVLVKRNRKYNRA